MMVSDRLVSIGTLAAGVAHEINNPLAALVANLGFAEQDLGRLLPDTQNGGAIDGQALAALDGRVGRRVVSRLRDRRRLEFVA